MGILRENGDKQLRAFHNALLARLLGDLACDRCDTAYATCHDMALLGCQDLQDLKGALRVFCRVRPSLPCAMKFASSLNLCGNATAGGMPHGNPKRAKDRR